MSVATEQGPARSATEAPGARLEGATPRCSVVIPAHNEAAVIARCLEALAPAGATGEAEVIVVCNGCRDDTAARARAAAPWARVLETSVASKSNALNLGDDAAGFFPRVYVDADVVLSAASLELIVEELASGRSLAAAPRAGLNLQGASWAVRAFYAVDSRLPWAKQGIGGTGVYALSREGRGRFARFPAITADDSFVRLQFAPGERRMVERAESVVTPPRRLRELIAIKGRSHLGKYELEAAYPELCQNGGFSNRDALLRMACNPLRLPALAVYAYVKLMARRWARWRLRQGPGEWVRDESSRQAALNGAA